MQSNSSISKGALWGGRIMSILVILFMLVDGGMKAARAAVSIDGSTQLGWPEPYVQGLGILLLVCTVLYAIPATAVLGAIFITGYLGGAISIMVRIDVPYWFPLVMGVMTWGGLYLQNEKLRQLIPLTR